MSTPIDTSCPNCATELRVPPELAGKKVTPLIVPTNNPLHAVLKTAMELRAQELVVGVSNKFTAEEQLDQMAFYWINLHGGEPANFLDVGGGANEQQVTEAFRIILSDPHVKAVLVNIFGGIARCSTIASAIVAASKAVGFNVPLVVRLEGTEVEEGKKILRESGVKLTTADDLTDAAKKVVAAVK
jgi:hypothetical protein